MKHFSFFGFLAALLFCVNSWAQAPWCGVIEHTHALDALHPEYKQSRAAIETYTQKWIEQNGTQKSTGNVLTIPVVVHVVHTTGNPASNISEAQILSQIEVLNEDFRRLNPDTVQTPAVFRPFAADFEVEFCLAKKDPNGYPTNGITRTPTTQTVFSVSSNTVKSAATGGANGWPSNRYLNIWVCNDLSADFTTNQILGYAQFPGSGSAQTDGVVAIYTAFGRVGALNPQTDKGRTTTHEVGHWLNLIHVWGDKDLPTGVDPSCATDDLVDDTPRTIEANFGCNLTANSCSNETPDYNDMIQNYMDYASENCQNMFTLGQKQRIRAVLEPGGFRNNIVSQPDICSVGANDVSALKVVSPAGTGVCTTFEPVIELVNSGSETLYYVEINYQVDNGPWVNTYWVGELPAFEWTNITLPTANTVLPGIIHTFTVEFTSPNGQADFKPADNLFSQSFATVPKGVDMPFVADFETGVFPATGWQVFNADNTRTFSQYPGAGNSGNVSVHMNNLGYNALGTIDEFTIPRVDLNEVNPQLEFFAAYNYQTTADVSDTLEVLVSTNCGNTFTSAYKISGSELVSALNPTASMFVPVATNWRRHTVSLWDFRGARSAVIKFRQIRGTGNNLYIDDINVFPGSVGIENNLPAAAMVKLYPNPVTSQHANLSFVNLQNGATDYHVHISNIAGKTVYAAQEPAANGVNNHPINTQNWASGIYFVHLTIGAQTITQKMVVVQ